MTIIKNCVGTLKIGTFSKHLWLSDTISNMNQTEKVSVRLVVI